MVQIPTETKVLFKKSLRILVDAGHVKEEDCDTMISSFSDCIRTEAEALSTFQKDKDRLDSFLYGILSSKYPNLWRKVVMKLLILSHGQASVERGFSLNKEVITENQHGQTLIARRLCQEYVKSIGGVSKLNISKEMLMSARSSRSRYQQHLAEEREREEKERRSNKRKAEEADIDEMKGSAKRLKTVIDSLMASSVEYADQCEKTGKVEFIVKANSMRRSADEKKKELDSLEKQIQERMDIVKQH